MKEQREELKEEVAPRLLTRDERSSLLEQSPGTHRSPINLLLDVIIATAAVVVCCFA